VSHIRKSKSSSRCSETPARGSDSRSNRRKGTDRVHRRLSVLMGFWTRISYRRANHCTKHPKGETFALSQAEMSACVGSQKVRLIISPLLLFLSLIVRSFSPSLNRTAQTSGRIRIMSNDIEDKKDNRATTGDETWRGRSTARSTEQAVSLLPLLSYLTSLSGQPLNDRPRRHGKLPHSSNAES
jgi:hypothetical protein